jgi:hypothetical protein
MTRFEQEMKRTLEPIVDEAVRSKRDAVMKTTKTVLLWLFWLPVAAFTLPLVVAATIGSVQNGDFAWLFYALLGLVLEYGPTLIKLVAGFAVLYWVWNYISKAPAYVGHIIVAVVVGIVLGGWLLKVLP